MASPLVKILLLFFIRWNKKRQISSIYCIMIMHFEMRIWYSCKYCIAIYVSYFVCEYFCAFTLYWYLYYVIDSHVFSAWNFKDKKALRFEQTVMDFSVFTDNLWATVTVVRERHLKKPIRSLVPDTKLAEFANSLDLNEVAHNEPPHLDLHSLPANLWILNMIWFGLNIFLRIRRRKFCRQLCGS